jgi:hypothetical protein
LNSNFCKVRLCQKDFYSTRFLLLVKDIYLLLFVLQICFYCYFYCFMSSQPLEITRKKFSTSVYTYLVYYFNLLADLRNLYFYSKSVKSVTITLFFVIKSKEKSKPITCQVFGNS